jgi:hypothetical protein
VRSPLTGLLLPAFHACGSASSFHSPITAHCLQFVAINNSTAFAPLLLQDAHVHGTPLLFIEFFLERFRMFFVSRHPWLAMFTKRKDDLLVLSQPLRAACLTVSVMFGLTIVAVHYRLSSADRVSTMVPAGIASVGIALMYRGLRALVQWVQSYTPHTTLERRELMKRHQEVTTALRALRKIRDKMELSTAQQAAEVLAQKQRRASHRRAVPSKGRSPGPPNARPGQW